MNINSAMVITLNWISKQQPNFTFRFDALIPNLQVFVGSSAWITVIARFSANLHFTTLRLIFHQFALYNF